MDMDRSRNRSGNRNRNRNRNRSRNRSKDRRDWDFVAFSFYISHMAFTPITHNDRQDLYQVSGIR